MSKTVKKAVLGGASVDYDADMPLINTYSRKELSPEDVYVFPVILCDNEVDRDYEAFSDAALEGFAPLFVGKTGIFNHSWDAKGQIARIYKTAVEDTGRKNSMGAPLRQLTACAYMIRNEHTADAIEKIESGILREVSVGLAVEKCVCSICSEKLGWVSCENGHKPGHEYDEGLCYGVLDGAKDAYEFSFVAVPSQRGAGVTKSFTESEIEAKVFEMFNIPKGADLSEYAPLWEQFKAVCEKALIGEAEREKRAEILAKNTKFLGGKQ